jgi:hypothetical protein
MQIGEEEEKAGMRIRDKPGENTKQSRGTQNKIEPDVTKVIGMLAACANRTAATAAGGSRRKLNPVW